jgi:hypothetical protein
VAIDNQGNEGGSRLQEAGVRLLIHLRTPEARSPFLEACSRSCRLFLTAVPIHGAAQTLFKIHLRLVSQMLFGARQIGQ